MRGRRLVQASIIPAILILVALAWLPRPCRASDEVRSVDAAAAEKLNLVVGKSVVVQSKTPVRRVSIAAPEIADAMVLSPRQIYLTGKTAGVTNMIMWGESDKVTAIFDVEVGPDVMTLKTKLHEMFPGEKGVLVTAARDGITLAGSVSGMTRMAQIIALAETYAPLDKTGKPKVTNLLEVSGVHQVMLEVRVSEMSRSLARNLGINFNVISASGRQFGLSLLDGLTSLPSSGGFPADPLQVSSNVNAILRFLGNGATWTVFVDALKENGLLHVLAEPTLITLSGKSANFLAGGEFPVPVPQSGTSTNTITVEYKSFGVALSFTPTVLMDGRINMVVAPEVSELDFSTAVSLQGFIIPGVTTRRVSTTVELADGQSFAIAGLIRQDVREDIKKFPLLGDIPILGPLFRSSSFKKNETELVVIVTPHLVKPMDVAKQTLPTDAFNEPDDFEFYVEGKTEGKGKGEKAPALPRAVRRGGLEGDFGYIIP